MNWSSPSLNSRYLFAADQRAQVGGERIDVDAEVGGARAIDVDAQLRLGRLEVGVDVDDAADRRGPSPSAATVYICSCSMSGP